MEVILRPLLRDKWAGVFKYKNCTDYVGTYFTRTGAIHTGLTLEDTERLGKLLGKDPKELSPSSEFWHNYYIRIGNKDIYLDTDNPEDELKYLFLKTHKRVANGFNDNNPTANYVLINKESEAKEANKFNQIKRKAIVAFGKLSLEEMRKALRLYGTNPENLSGELVENRLFEIVEKDPEKFLDRWVDNKRRETEYLIQEAVAKNIIRKNKSEYKYGTDTIGHLLDDAINYLDSPEHRDLKQIIINDINAK
jgi:hypothetical protein